MKKQLLTLILSMTISAALLTGCGSTAPAPDTTVSETTETGDAAVTDGDSVQDTPDTSAPVSDDHTSGSEDEEEAPEPENAPAEPSDDESTEQPEQIVDDANAGADKDSNKGTTDKPDKPAKTDKPAQTDKPNKTEKPNKTDKPAKTEKPAQTDKPDKTDKPAPEDKNEAADKGDLASSLYQIFETEIAKTDDIEQVAAKIVETGNFGEVMMGTMPVEEGYLSGFEVEIKGFQKGMSFGPMIGTIPFIGYIFETDTPDELVATLEKEHKLNWNICTSADRMLVQKKGNYVFFVMSPDSFGKN